MRPKVNIALLLVNVFGAILYLVAAAHSWVIPQERGLQSTTGEPFIWALYVLPIWAFFSLIDLTWGAFILRRRWTGRYMWAASILVWVAAIGIDFAHH